MSKQKAIKDMSDEEHRIWLDQYIADMPKRLEEYDRFTKMAAISMGAALLAVPIMLIIASITNT